MLFAVFCGSNSGHSDVYREAAAALGRELAAQDIGLVFGGTAQGLMKITADAVYARGGVIHGIIPRVLIQKGKVYEHLTITEEVATRTERKLRMAEIASGFIAMPGGIGTLEEIFEMWVNAQFEGHHKPLALYNVNGFFDRMLEFLDGMVSEGFLPSQQRGMLITASDPAALLEKMQAHQPVDVSKWL